MSPATQSNLTNGAKLKNRLTCSGMNKDPLDEAAVLSKEKEDTKRCVTLPCNFGKLKKKSLKASKMWKKEERWKLNCRATKDTGRQHNPRTWPSKKYICLSTFIYSFKPVGGRMSGYCSAACWFCRGGATGSLLHHNSVPKTAQKVFVSFFTVCLFMRHNLKVKWPLASKYSQFFKFKKSNYI